MTGKGGDYEGWILRLIEKPEDLLHSYTLQDWLQFAAEKIEGYHNTSITKSQIDSLSEYRNIAFELPEDLGITIVKTMRYRDDKGHWATAETGHPWKEIMEFRDISSMRFKKTSEVNDMIQAEIEARLIR